MKRFFLISALLTLATSAFGETGSAIESAAHARAGEEEGRMYFSRRMTAEALNCSQQIDGSLNGYRNVSITEKSASVGDHLVNTLASTLLWVSRTANAEIKNVRVQMNDPAGHHQELHCKGVLFHENRKEKGMSLEDCVGGVGYHGPRHFTCLFEENVAAHNNLEREFRKDAERLDRELRSQGGVRH